MTDREMLELAAKAGGLDVWIDENGTPWIDGDKKVWNPLADDGDALRLMVALEMQVDQQGNTQRAVAMWQKHRTIRYVAENFDGNPLAATRRAITRAAAEIGKAMP